MPHDLRLFNRGGEQVGDVHGIYKTWLDELRDRKCSSGEMRHVFDAPTFMRVPGVDLPILNVLSISSTVRIAEKSRHASPVRLPAMSVSHCGTSSRLDSRARSTRAC
jgi:hypothetical protein